MTAAGTDGCTVTLSAAAPSGGESVTLSSSDGVVSVPATVTVPANATTAGFSATVASFSTSQSATLTAGAGGATKTFALQLNAGTPTLSANSTNVSFGNVTVGQTAKQSVTLTSTGTAPVTISSISVSGSLFTASGVTAPVTLNPGQKTTLNLQFNANHASSFTGILTIASNSSQGNVVVNMSGSGVAAPGTLEFPLMQQRIDVGSGNGCLHCEPERTCGQQRAQCESVEQQCNGRGSSQRYGSCQCDQRKFQRDGLLVHRGAVGYADGDCWRPDADIWPSIEYSRHLHFERERNQPRFRQRGAQHAGNAVGDAYVDRYRVGDSEFSDIVGYGLLDIGSHIPGDVDSQPVSNVERSIRSDDNGSGNGTTDDYEHLFDQQHGDRQLERNRSSLTKSI